MNGILIPLLPFPYTYNSFRLGSGGTSTLPLRIVIRRILSKRLICITVDLWFPIREGAKASAHISICEGKNRIEWIDCICTYIIHWLNFCLFIKLVDFTKHRIKIHISHSQPNKHHSQHHPHPYHLPSNPSHRHHQRYSNRHHRVLLLCQNISGKVWIFHISTFSFNHSLIYVSLFIHSLHYPDVWKVGEEFSV